MPSKKKGKEDLELEAELLSVVSKPKDKLKKRKDLDEEEEGEIKEEFLSEEEEAPRKRQKKNSSSKEKKGKIDRDQVSSGSDAEEFKDGYDEDLMGDEADRKHLFSLPELEREAIIAERYARRKELKERHQIKQQLKKDKKYTKGDSTPTRRESKRVKTSSTGSVIKQSALSDLKKRRAKQARETHDSESASESSESEDNRKDDSDEEFQIQEASKSFRDEEKEEKEDKEEEKSSSLSAVRMISREELNKICLTRNFLDRTVEEPFFNEIVTGFYVRIGIGMNLGKPVYRVGQIIDVKEGQKKYKVIKTLTNKQLLLKYGSSVKHFTMEHVSNQPVTEEEYSKWMVTMDNSQQPVMTNKEAEQKLQSLQKIKNYRYTDEQVAKMIEKKKHLKGDKEINLAAMKVQLINARDAAKDAGNLEEYNRLVLKIQKIEGDLHHDLQSKKHQDSAVDKINKRNKEVNQTKQFDASLSTTIANPDNDPFSRRQTRPVAIVHLAQKDEKPSTEKPNETPKPTTNGTVEEKKVEEKTAEEKKVEQKLDEDDTNNNNNIVNDNNTQKINANATTKTENTQPANKMGDDPDTILKQAHNFDLDITKPAPVPATPFRRHTPVEVPDNKKPIKTLSVDDYYKRRRGLQ